MHQRASVAERFNEGRFVVVQFPLNCILQLSAALIPPIYSHSSNLIPLLGLVYEGTDHLIESDMTYGATGIMNSAAWFDYNAEEKLGV